MELTIERIVAGGAGLARTADGLVALVRGGLPGERVLAGLTRKKGYLAGSVMQILEARPDRDPAPLPPGADLPLHYPAQLPIKQEIVEEALRRAGVAGFAFQPIQGSPDALGYRTAAQYAVMRDRTLAARQQGSRLLVPLERDPLLAEPLAAAFAELSGRVPAGVREVLLRGSLYERRTLVGLVGERSSKTRSSEQALLGATIAGVSRVGDRFAPDRGRGVAGAGSLLEDFGGILTTVTARSFAQVNPRAAGLLYREAAQVAGSGTRAVDLYAGSGVLALHLAPKFEQVVAVESSVDAVRRGDADRKRLGASSLRFHAGDARALSEHLPADLVSINPPRAGAAPEVCEALNASDVPRVLYVSCDPATWARDVARLSTGGFRLTYARPFDFYPYTHHVEVLSLLER